MVPQIALAVPLFMLFDSLAMTDSYISLILAYTSFNIPYVIWLLLPFFSSISYSLKRLPAWMAAAEYRYSGRSFSPSRRLDLWWPQFLRS